MPQVPQSFGQFGGLRLDQSIDAVSSSEAIDMLDVDWGAGVGIVKNRSGVEIVTASAAAAAYGPLWRHNNSQLLTLRASTLAVINLEVGFVGTEKATQGAEAAHTTFATMGTPAASYTYIAQPGKTIKRWDGTAFSEPTATVDEVAGKAMPKGNFIATWPDGGNRLVVAGAAAGPNGATSSSSHVWFSMPGDATGYESTAYVQVSPGDGEAINGVTVWNGQVFVFKETRLFIFYGVAVDQEGHPVFNYRTVDLGTRKGGNTGATSGEQCAAAPEGVFFVSRDGLWLTTGQAPVLVSSALDPLARNEALPGPAAALFDEPIEPSEVLFAKMRFSLAGSLLYSKGRLYLKLNSAVNTDPLLVFDLVRRAWLVWKSSFNAMAESGTGSIYFTGKSNKRIFRFVEGSESDASLPGVMAPRWQSGFYDLEDDDEKSLIMAKVWGTGEPVLKVAKDFGALSTGTVMKLGTAPTIGVKIANKSQTGTLFSHQFSGAAPWSVQRLTRYLREERVPGTKTK